MAAQPRFCSGVYHMQPELLIEVMTATVHTVRKA